MTYDDFEHDETLLRPAPAGERSTSGRVQVLDPDSGAQDLVDAIRAGLSSLEELAAASGHRVDPAEISIAIGRRVNGKIEIIVTGDLRRP